MTQHTGNTDRAQLEKLDTTPLILSDPGDDVRGRKVVDRSGDEIGQVSALFVDREHHKVRFLQVEAGGFLGLGERHFLVPVDAVTRVTPDEVHVDQTRERVVNSPAYDPKLRSQPEDGYWDRSYGYFGFFPFWGSGYRDSRDDRR